MLHLLHQQTHHLYSFTQAKSKDAAKILLKLPFYNKAALAHCGHSMPCSKTGLITLFSASQVHTAKIQSVEYVCWRTESRAEKSCVYLKLVFAIKAASPYAYPLEMPYLINVSSLTNQEINEFAFLVGLFIYLFIYAWFINFCLSEQPWNNS